ncbi:MAG TPA: hypothetical protein DCF65_12060 [Chloroflexi bacterium]|nr:hypothetical protein [Chloroflexota bacterium]HAF20611.1 hypothetical protein [Chloroflexota bacterium]
MRTSRRFHLNLPSELESALTDFAHPRGLRLGPAIRLLLGDALKSASDGPGARLDPPGILAALTAAELAVLMVASVLPEGQRRMHELGAQAAVAAEERLALFRELGQ